MTKPTFRLVPASSLRKGDEVMLVVKWREYDETKSQICSPVRITSEVEERAFRYGNLIKFRHTHGRHELSSMAQVYRRVK